MTAPPPKPPAAPRPTPQAAAGRSPVGQPAGKTVGKAALPVRRTQAPAPRKLAPVRPSLGERLQARVSGIRLRLLPVTIFVAVLMLGFRTADIWRVAARDPSLPSFPVSVAETQPSKPPAGAPAAGSEKPSASPAPAGTVPAATPATATGGGAGDPLGPIDSKELAQRYAERRADLERRTKEVEQREALLAAAEKRIDQKLQELDKVRGEIQKLLRLGDQRQSEQLDSLVKIYETMKPKEAARIFEEMDMPVMLDVIGRMKETKTAPILAAMDPLKAKAVTSALVERRALPALPQ